jgi:hypothetical protein
MNENTVTVIELILIVIIYLLPTIVAFGRDIPHKATITIFNIILGWTLIGWLVLFIWALSAETAPEELA